MQPKFRRFLVAALVIFVVAIGVQRWMRDLPLDRPAIPKTLGAPGPAKTAGAAGQPRAPGAPSPVSRSPAQLWSTPTQQTGARLPAAGAGGRSPGAIGRTAQLALATVTLDSLREGALVRIPVFDGEVLTGRVVRRKVEASGLTLIGGELTGSRSGTFSFSQGNSGINGFVLLPAEGLAWVVEEVRSGGGSVLRLVEKPLADVICSPYPSAPPGTRYLAETSNGAESAAAALVVPVLSSRPAATAVLFLDLDGETVSDPNWNGGQTIDAKPSTLTADEITAVWRRVTEDYVGFDVDITTDVRRYNSAAPGHRMRCIVTPTDLAARGAGGVAYVNSFSEAGKTMSDTIPCWVFNPGVIGVAEAVSHELGHTLGLRHDGRTSPSEEYYLGQGDGPLSWAPIMGVGYYRNVVQWSKGEYTAANNHEDDIAVIASTLNAFGFSADEAGGTPETATTVPAGALGEVEVPAVIQSSGDTDLFRIAIPAGRVRLGAAPTGTSPNLDVLLTLQDSSGAVLASANPDAALAASIDYPVAAAGTYFIGVSGTGHGDPLLDGYSGYGSTGAYLLSGEIPVGDGVAFLPTGEQVTAPRSIVFHYQIRAANAPTSYAASGLPAGLTLDSNTGVIAGIPTAAASAYTVALSVTNALGTNSGSLVITLTAEPAPVITVDALRLARLGRPFSLPVVANALPQSYSVLGLPAGLAIDAVSGVISGSPSAAGVYRVTLGATNATGSDQAEFTLAVVAEGETVAAGVEHALYVRNDGTLWSAGTNRFGQLGDGSTTTRAVPVQTATGVGSVASGSYHSVFIKTDGSLWGMGSNSNGQLGGTSQTSTPVPMAAGVLAAAAGSGHTLFVKTDGTLWGLGRNDAGQLGDGTTTWRSSAVPIDTTVAATAANSVNSAYVKTDGSLWAMGNNSSGQIGDGTTTNRATPVKIADNVFAVAVGASFTVFLKSDGTLWRTGSANWMGLSDTGAASDHLPQRIASGIVRVAAGPNATLFTTADGVLWMLGWDGHSTLTKATKLADGAVSLAVNDGFMLYATADGKFWGRGSNLSRALGDGTVVERATPLAIADNVGAMAAGEQYSLWAKQDGSLWGAGANANGQLGDGSSEIRGTAVHTADGVLTPVGGASHSLLLKADGDLWGVGFLADWKNHLAPIRLGETARAAAAGGSFSLWVRSDRTLWGVGYNYAGVLGDGTNTWRDQPVFLQADVAGVTAGNSHALWWTSEGVLWGDGSNSEGQLGDGTAIARSRPVRLATGVRKAVTGSGHSLYLTTDDTLLAMGANYDGELGDGTTTRHLTAVSVASDVADAAANQDESFFVKRDGTLWAMGRLFGLTPVRIARGAIAVAARGGHALILKADRSLWAIGRNDSGQLADGATLYYPTPTEVRLGRPGIVASTLPFEARLGGTATFAVAATGEGALAYQWRRNGVAIAGATGASYTISGVQAADGGTYDVVVANAVDTTTSTATPLTVLDTAPVFSSASAVTAARLQPFTFRLQAENEPTAFTADGLPAGLTIAADTGLISGVPTAAAAAYTVTVTASNPHGTDSGSLVITLTAAAAPHLAMSGTLVARRGVACRFIVVATSAPQSFGAVGLPAGLSIDPTTGVIAGTPTASAGPYAATISALNEGGTGTVAVRIAVVPEWQDRAGGDESTLVVDPQGILWGAGSNRFGQLGDGSTTNRSTPVRIADNVVSVAGGVSHTLFVKSDGTLWGMGWNIQGLLGLGDRVQRNSPVQIDTDVVAAASGYNHIVYLKSDGTAWAAGYNESGQFGDGTQTASLRPVQVATSVAAVAAGSKHSLFLRTDGTLWAAGSNASGQLGDGTFGDHVAPIQIAANVTAIASGASASYFIKSDGTLWGAGFNGLNQLKARADSDSSYEPAPVKISDGAIAVSGGLNQSLYVTSDGKLWGRGMNWWAQLGDQTKQFSLDPRVLAEGVAFGATGYAHSMFGQTAGGVWVMGTNSAGQIADGFDAAQFTPVRVAQQVKQAAAGDAHSLFLTTDGDLWAMGYNGLGSLGDGTRNDSATPVKIAEGVARVATSWWHSAFVKRDGTLWMMGNNSDGELGNGSTAPNGVPRPFQVMAGVTAVSTGAWHTVVLKTDQTVWAMGWNGQGQLGDGTYVQKTLPTQVMTGVIEVAAGAKHTLFLKEDGSLWATGDNETGQLGDGSTAGRTVPVQIATGVAHIAAGGWHSLWVRTDGTLWGAGYNGEGALGDGTSTDRLSPVQIDSGVQSVSGGTYHTSYIKQDGSVWMTGRNYEGQLGDGAAAGSAQAVTPAAAGDFVGVRAVESEVQVNGPSRASPGPSGGAGLTPPRFVVRPGAGDPAAEVGVVRATIVERGGVGFLQNTSPQIRYQPVRIATGGRAVAAGGYHSLYVRRDGSLWAMGQALYGRLGHGGGRVQWDARQIEFGTPAILGQSIPFAVRLGQTADFSVSAAGTGTLTYQWRKNGSAVAAATGAHYLVSGVAAADGGVYDVVVTNELGAKACTAVNVSVVDAPPAIIGALTVSGPRLSDDFEYRIAANNDATTYAASGLPAGLSLDPDTGVISGRIEAAVGPVPVTVSATNANGTTSAVLTIDITAQAAPVVTSATTMLARQGQSLHLAITASNSPTGFSALDLPAGLTVDAATGMISGKVTAAAGDVISTVVASNSSGQGMAQVKFIVLPVWAGLAGSQHSLIVDDQGTLWGMGKNSNGQLANGTQSDRSAPKPLAMDVVAVAAASNVSLFLKADGSLWAAGFLPFYSRESLVPEQIASRARALAAGSGHMLYVDWDGVLWACGTNSHGELGDGTTTERATPVAIATDVASVAAGGFTSLYVKRDGTLWGMGDNENGQLGDGTTTDRATPIQMMAGVAMAAVSYSHALIVKQDGTLWACGSNWFGRLGDGTTESRTTPVLIRSGVAAAWVNQGSLFLTRNGELWAVGETGPSSWSNTTPKQVASAIAGAAEGDSHVLLIDAAGRILAAGGNAYGQLGESTLSLSYPAKVADDVVRVSGAYDHTMWVKQDGSLWGAGDSSSGQRGANYYSIPLDPARVDTGGSVTDVAAGGYYTLYLRQNGTLWGMGTNGVGQLTGSGPSVYTAIQMATDAVGVAVGNSCSFYISGARELWGTGANYAGQLGDGTHTSRADFVKIADRVESVTASGGNTLILRTDATLWGAGGNWHSQLGGTPGSGSAVPIQLATDVIAAAGSEYHTLYVTRGGALWAMGGNSSGQLGDGTLQTHTVPLQVASDVQAVSAAGESSYFLKLDGTLWAMGQNSSGELGDGSQQRRLQPVLVATGVRAVSAAPQAGYFIKRDRTLWGVGSNYRGRLGIQLIPSRAEPVELVLGKPAVETLSIPVVGNVGGTAQFTVTASGVGELAYQWRKDGQPIAGATGAGYFLGVVTGQDGGLYDVVVTGTWGSTASNPALFTVLNAAPVITSALSADAIFGVGFEYRVTANNDADVFGATGLPHGLSLDSTTGRIAGTPDDIVGSYVVALSAGNGQGTAQAVLTLELALPAVVPPAITTTPSSQSIQVGASASFTVSASGTPTPTLQWQVSPDGSTWTDLTDSGLYGGATTGTLNIVGATLAMSGYRYRVVATNSAGSATSNAATLAVNGIAPTITTPPGGQTVTAGGSTSFTVAAVGTPMPTLQWQVSTDGSTWADLTNLSPYSGVTTGTLQITSATLAMNGYHYRAVATNGAGSATSAAMTLTVTSYAGMYFGTFANGGHWALTVNPDGSGTYLAYLGDRKTAVVVSVMVAADGSFSVNGVEIGAQTQEGSVRALSLTSGSGKHLAAVAGNFTLSGRISASLVTGQLSGLSQIFTGMRDAAAGAAPSGYYTASQTNGAGTSYAIVAPSGQALVITAASTGVDAATGTVSATGELSATTVAGGQLSATITAAGPPLRLTLTPAGSSTPLNFDSAPVQPASGSAAHTVTGSGTYLAGRTVTITNTLSYSGTVTGLSWQVLLPDGWSYASGSGSEAKTKPIVGTTAVLEWTWTTVPASPVTLTYSLAVPGAATGPQQLAAIVILRAAQPAQLLVKPDPLVLNEGRTYHDADTNHDWKLSLLELARVIELYNTRNGATRTGCYAVQEGTEDGFAAAPARAANSTATLTRYHSADTDHNGRLSLLELARVIELYNQRTGGARTGQYHVQSGTEDGYTTGL